MDLFCRVTPAGLVPLDDMDWEQKKQLRLGSDVRVHITMPRNLRFHKKFMALLRLTLDNLPEDIQQSMRIYSIEAMLAAVKIDLGYYDTVQVSGRNVVNSGPSVLLKWMRRHLNASTTLPSPTFSTTICKEPTATCSCKRLKRPSADDSLHTAPTPVKTYHT